MNEQVITPVKWCAPNGLAIIMGTDYNTAEERIRAFTKQKEPIQGVKTDVFEKIIKQEVKILDNYIYPYSFRGILFSYWKQYHTIGTYLVLIYDPLVDLAINNVHCITWIDGVLRDNLTDMGVAHQYPYDKTMVSQAWKVCKK